MLEKIKELLTESLINEQDKRNITQFPPDFMFQLTQEELANLKSQNATSSWGTDRKTGNSKQ